MGLGGVFYTESAPPFADVMEICVELPFLAGEMSSGATTGGQEAVSTAALCGVARVLRVQRDDATGQWGIHLAFQDLPLESERVLARFIDQQLLDENGGNR